MEIKTEYSINDTVYLLADSSIWVGAITDIRISVNRRNDMQIVYDVKCIMPSAERFTVLKANRLFKTKEDLVKSLLSNIEKK